MLPIREYKRARSLDEARELLTLNAAYLAGGTRLISTNRRDLHTLVDITGLGLDGMREGRLGATARLQDVLESRHTPELLREAIRHHLPWTWRNAATIGGECVFGGAESDLLIALLALDGQFVVDGQELPLDQQPKGLVTEIRYRQPRAGAFLKVSRIKTEKAIVNASVAVLDDGLRLVLGGVGDRPVVVRGTELPQLDPPSDFRGSADYRRELAQVLARRALEAVA